MPTSCVCWHHILKTHVIFICRFVGCLSLALFLAAPFPVLAESDQRIVDDPVYTGPSRLVEIGTGRKLNLYCTGAGSPVVVFESGLGDSTKSWGLVQPEVSRRTRACSYDRAGLGFSDAANFPRTSANAAEDLSKLLQAAGEHPPFVLVGHSYGGMIVKLFAFTHPSEVAGVVLVDPSHEDVGRELFALDPQSREKNLKYLEQLQSCVVREGPSPLTDEDFASLCIAEAGPRYSESIRTSDRLLATQPQRIAAWVSEMQNIWQVSADQVRDEARSLGDIPLVVITKEPSRPNQDETPALREKKNAALSRQHDQTAALSSQGRRILLKDSGHYIQLDQPSAVIEAILQVLGHQPPETHEDTP